MCAHNHRLKLIFGLLFLILTCTVVLNPDSDHLIESAIAEKFFKFIGIGSAEHEILTKKLAILIKHFTIEKFP